MLFINSRTSKVATRFPRTSNAAADSVTMQSLNNTTASTPAKAQMQDIASNHRGNQLNLRQYKDLKKKVYDEVVDARDITIECRDNDSQDIICVTS